MGAGREEFGKALEALKVGDRAPGYPGMGTAEILAVRKLVGGGMAHDEAYTRVREAKTAAPTSKPALPRVQQ